MSNARVAKRIRRDRERRESGALRSEAGRLGVPTSGKPFLVWLALMRDYGLSGPEAKAQMDQWKAEQAADLMTGMIGRFFS